MTQKQHAYCDKHGDNELCLCCRCTPMQCRWDKPDGTRDGGSVKKGDKPPMDGTHWWCEWHTVNTTGKLDCCCHHTNKDCTKKPSADSDAKVRAVTEELYQSIYANKGVKNMAAAIVKAVLELKDL